MAGMLLPCLILGGHIANGIHEYRPACTYIGRDDASSRTVLRLTPEKGRYRQAIVSVGYNNPNSASLRSDMYKIRAKLGNIPVTWIAPRNRKAAQIMYTVAVSYNDRIVYAGNVRPLGAIWRKSDWKKLAKGLPK